MIIPLMASPLPFIYLEVECTTTSAPYWIGLSRYGVEVVLSTISGTPFPWRKSAVSRTSITFSAGFPTISPNTALVLSVRNGSISAFSTLSIKCTFIPNASRSWSRSSVPPNNALPAITSSPACRILSNDNVTADIPEEQATPPIPPSNSFTLRSNASTVGFAILVYANPGARFWNTFSNCSEDS